MVVTGTFLPLPPEEIDRSVSVIEGDNSPALYNHWVDLLKTESSVDLRSRAPNDIQSDISIRGSSFGEILILLNGFRMDDAQSGHHDLDLPLPTGSLGRIEILRGAGSTFYGSDAIGGAVNFLTARPTQTDVQVGAGIGNFGVNQQSGTVSLLHGDWDQQLGVARDFSTGFIPDRDYRSFTVFSESGLKTHLGRTDVMLAYGDKPFGADQFYGDFNSWERTKSWFAALKQDLGRQTEFDVGYRRHSDVFVLLRDDPAFYENNHISESWQAALRRHSSFRRNTTISYGLEGDWDGIRSTNLGDHSRTRGAAYLNADFRVLRRLSLSVGAREEVFGSSRREFSPTFATGFWLKPGLKLKGSVGRAFRLPSYTDLYYHDPANVGNPNLRPESAWSYDAGFEWDNGGKVHAQATVFQNRERDVIDYVKFFAADVNHATNVERLIFEGVESSLQIELPRQERLDASITLIHGTQNALKGVASSQYVFNYPITNAIVGWQGTLPWHLLARTQVGVTQRFARNPYALWNLDVGKRFRKFGTRVSFSNLADVRYEEVAGVPMPGRSVVLGLDYFLKSEGPK